MRVARQAALERTMSKNRADMPLEQD